MPESLVPSTSVRTYVAVAAVALAAAAAWLRPWEGRPQPGFPLVVKSQDIFACREFPLLQGLYPLLRAGDVSGFVREGQKLTSRGDCIYLGRGVQVTGYASGDPRVVKVRRETGDRVWLAPRAVFEGQSSEK